MSIRSICASMNMSYTPVRNWLLHTAHVGIKGNYDEVRLEAQGMLDDSQSKRLQIGKYRKNI